jgi:hypothetical protein
LGRLIRNFPGIYCNRNDGTYGAEENVETGEGGRKERQQIIT